VVAVPIECAAHRRGWSPPRALERLRSRLGGSAWVIRHSPAIHARATGALRIRPPNLECGSLQNLRGAKFGAGDEA
jgi:hypothetical protein